MIRREKPLDAKKNDMGGGICHDDGGINLDSWTTRSVRMGRLSAGNWNQLADLCAVIQVGLSKSLP